MKRSGMWRVLAMLLWLGPGWAGAQETAQTTPGGAPAAPAVPAPAAAEVRRTDPPIRQDKS